MNASKIKIDNRLVLKSLILSLIIVPFLIDAEEKVTTVENNSPVVSIQELPAPVVEQEPVEAQPIIVKAEEKKIVQTPVEAPKPAPVPVVVQEPVKSIAPVIVKQELPAPAPVEEKKIVQAPKAAPKPGPVKPAVAKAIASVSSTKVAQEDKKIAAKTVDKSLEEKKVVTQNPVKEQSVVEQLAQAQAQAQALLYGVKFSGYIRNDTFYDTRQVAGSREDDFILFPYPKIIDSCCQDIYERGQYNMLPIQTRFKWAIRGPNIWNAQAMGMIEADFTGPWVLNNNIDVRGQGGNSTISGLYLNDAYFRLGWEKTSVLIGQTIHPFIEPRATGGLLVIEPLSRNPQIRVTHELRPKLEGVIAVLAQLDYKNFGQTPFGDFDIANPDARTPYPAQASSYVRNSLMPEFHFHLKKYWNEHIVGIATSVKRIQPSLFDFSTEIDECIFQTDLNGDFIIPKTAQGLPVVDPATVVHVKLPPTLQNTALDPAAGTIIPKIKPIDSGVPALLTNGRKIFRTEKTFPAISAMVYAGLQFKHVAAKAKLWYGEALDDQITLGGYGVSNFNAASGHQSYTPLRAVGMFGELSRRHPTIQPSLQFGYVKSVGSAQNLYDFTQLGEREVNIRIPSSTRFLTRSNYLVYGIAPMIDYVAKVYPNIKIIKGQAMFWVGLEFSRAGYGQLQCDGTVCDICPVNNVRASVSTFYFF